MNPLELQEMENNYRSQARSLSRDDKINEVYINIKVMRTKHEGDMKVLDERFNHVCTKIKNNRYLISMLMIAVFGTAYGVSVM